MSFKSYFLWRERPRTRAAHVNSQIYWCQPFSRVSGVYYSQVIKTKVVERPCCTAVWLVKTSSCKESGVLESRGYGGTLIPTSLWHCFNCSQLETHHSCSPPVVVTWPGCSASDHLEIPAESTNRTFGSSRQSLDETKTDCKIRVNLY